MRTAFFIRLPEQAILDLAQLADRENRDTRQQATRLLLDGLRTAGFDSCREVTDAPAR